jgi:two-component system chemotaxis response regulator CheB
MVVIGASAGGVEVLKRVVEQLPSDLGAAIFIVLHTSPYGEGYLPQILSKGAMRVGHAEDGEAIVRGRIYVAPPNRHMVIENDHVHLSSGPKENRHRPAVNPLFRSAAMVYGPRVVGVILTGNLDDGTSGLWEVKRRGGIAIVQDPAEAPYRGMPESAMANVEVDYVISLDELPQLLVSLVGCRAARPAFGTSVGSNNVMESTLTRFTCPECRGPLNERQGGSLHEFECRVGHTYGPEALLSAHAETIERTLWSGVVALEESADIARRLQSILPDKVKTLQREEKSRQKLAKCLREIIDQLVAETVPRESSQS